MPAGVKGPPLLPSGTLKKACGERTRTGRSSPGEVGRVRRHDRIREAGACCLDEGRIVRVRQRKRERQQLHRQAACFDERAHGLGDVQRDVEVPGVKVNA